MRIASHSRIHLDVDERKDGTNVYVITMDRGENRVNAEFVESLGNNFLCFSFFRELSSLFS